MRAIAIWESEIEKVRVLCNQEGDRLTSSVVMFDTQTNQSIVAKSALSSIISHPGQVIYSVKRFIGCNFRVRRTARLQKLNELYSSSGWVHMPKP